jgi:FkbM family methyltransferase
VQAVKDFVHRLPLVGELIHRVWLVAFRHEGRVFDVQGGALQGTRLHQFRTTFTDTYLSGDYELPCQQVLIAWVKPGQVVYDLGANGGFLTLLAAKLVGPSGMVVAFEPTRDTARKLRAQLRLNRVNNVRVIQSAVSDREGKSRFVEDGCYMSRLDGMDSEYSGGTVVQVETTSLDNLAGSIPPPDFMKIDIEGAELHALRGAKQLIRAHRPVMLVELHSAEICRQFHAQMKELNYEVRLPEGTAADPGRYERHVVAYPAEQDHHRAGALDAQGAK